MRLIQELSFIRYCHKCFDAILRDLSGHCRWIFAFNISGDTPLLCVIVTPCLSRVFDEITYAWHLHTLESFHIPPQILN